MSRRAPAGADRTEQNRATLKQLVKLESNKSCADCKRNKHPRWASWNIGVFVCIRCSGIHRGMGTHISRVKSVDLDSWTDEQTQSMLRWGNARANRYWEAKLADGHVPNDAKIENFIRTKYDSRRWVMDGPMPDPSSLRGDDEGTADDDVPLNIVRENAIARSASQRNGSAPAAALPQPPRQRQPQVDLFGDSFESEPARPSTTEPAVQRPGPPKAPAAPPKSTRPGESLLGLDFLGGPPPGATSRPASTGPGTPGVPGRADLKSSILSLYASKPTAAPQSQQQRSNVNLFGGMQSPSAGSPGQQQSQSSAQALGGLDDAFGSLSFSQQQPQSKPGAFSNLTSPTAHTRQPSSSKSPLSGGSFFDIKPAQPARQAMSPPASNPPPITTMRKESFGNDWGDFSSGPSPPASSVKSPPANTSSMGDLFGLSSPPMTSKPTTTSPPAQQQSYSSNSAFNLSQQPPAQAKPTSVQSPPAPSFSNLSNMDAWGSNDAWATPDPPSQPAPAPAQTSASTFKPAAPAAAPAPQMSAFNSGWGDDTPAPAPTVATQTTTTTSSGFAVQQDEEFGGWSHASPVATTSGPKQGGLGGNQDDLFGNVWE